MTTHHHREHYRGRRWAESTHVLVGGGITVLLILAVVWAVGASAPPETDARAIPRALEK